MNNETDGNSTNNPLEDEGNIYLIDFAYGVFIREKELYVMLFALLLATAMPLAIFIAAGIML